MQNIYEVQAKNKFKSTVVVLGFFVFIAVSLYFISQALGYYLGYEAGSIGYLGLALIISGLTSFASYYYSDKIVLTISGARPAERKRDFHFYTSAENLAIGAGLPRPKLYVIEDSAPNAFATGRDHNHAVIVATRGLLDKLDRSELEGVLAHELTHIQNYDIRLQSVVAVLVGTVALLADWLVRVRWYQNRDNDREQNQLGVIIMVIGIVMAILSPIIAQIIQLAISRRREFMADAGSVKITRQPDGLIKALKKISEDQEILEVANKATAHLFIANPYKQKGKVMFASLFNTHPPLEERIKALEKMR